MRFLETDREQIANVANRWRRQYYKEGHWTGCMDQGSEMIYARLAALPVDASREDVAAIIGNDSWIGFTCHECRERTAIVLVGEDPDYESATVYLCRPCYEKLQDLMSGSHA